MDDSSCDTRNTSGYPWGRNEPGARFHCSESIVVVPHYYVYAIAAGSLEVELASTVRLELIEASVD